jgi:hypothetical protein
MHYKLIERLVPVDGLVVCALTLPACSTGHVPARSPHVAVIVEHGSLTYVREDQHFPMGFLGSGLADAVQGDPRAEHEANLYTKELSWGLGSALGGLGLAITGLAVLPVEEHGGVRMNARAYTGFSLLALGAAAYTTGLILVLSAAPHQWDAINIYNDDIDARLRAQFMAQRPAAPGYQLAPVALPTLSAPPFANEPVPASVAPQRAEPLQPSGLVPPRPRNSQETGVQAP